jgi:chromosome segregation ATPase
LDLHEEVRDLQIRVTKLESSTVSGVPETSIAQRFTNMHDRVDQVGRNILDRITKVETALQTVRSEMAEGFSKVDARFEAIDVRFEKIDVRFEKIDGQFEAIDARFEKIDGRINLLDDRLDKLDGRVADVEAGLQAVRSEMADGFSKINGNMGEIKAMLSNLGAKASPN